MAKRLMELNNPTRRVEPLRFGVMVPVLTVVVLRSVYTGLGFNEVIRTLGTLCTATSGDQSAAMAVECCSEKHLFTGTVIRFSRVEFWRGQTTGVPEDLTLALVTLPVSDLTVFDMATE